MSTPETVLHCGPYITLAACLWLALAEGLDNRAIARRYAALAARLHRVADTTDAVMAMPEDLLNAQLEAKFAAADNAREEKK